MASQIIQSIDIPALGGVQTIDVTQLPLPDVIILYSSVNPLVVSGNYTLQFSATPPNGTKIEVYWNFDAIDTETISFQIFGDYYQSSSSQNPLRVKGAGFIYTVDGNGLPTKSHITPLNSGAGSMYLDGLLLMENTVPLTAIEQIGAGNIIVGDGSDNASYVTMSGDVTIDASGVTAICSGKVTNTHLAGSIARTKLASGTADRVLTNNGAGAYTELAQLTAKLGGLGVDNSGATGFVTFNAGTASVNAFTDTNHVNVSFETGYVGDFKVKMGFAGTVTSAYAFLTKTIGAVDAVITIKNNAGTTMGSITFTASDAKGTAQTVAISANNTFSAGDVLTFTTSGGSTTGEALVSYSFTRNS